VPHVRVTEFAAAPPERVWAAHVDAARIPDWFPGVRRVETISGPIDTPGATYALRFNRLVLSRVEVMEVQVPLMHTRRWDARPFATHGTATLLLRPGPGGTHLDLDVTYGLPLGALGRFLERRTFVRRRAARDVRRELQSFRAFAERYGA
jgi:hypothetical protein